MHQGGPQAESAQKVPGAPPMSHPNAENYPGATPGWVGEAKSHPRVDPRVRGGPRAESPKNQWKSCPQVPHIKKSWRFAQVSRGSPTGAPGWSPPAAGGPPCAHERTWMGERRRRRCADHLSGHILGGVAGGVAVVQSDTKEEPTALAFSCLPCPLLVLFPLLSPLIPPPCHLI